MIQIRPYRQNDEKQIDPIEPTPLGHPDYQACWDELIDPAYTWTGWHEGRIIGVGGIIPNGKDAFSWIQLDRNTSRSVCMRLTQQAIRLGESFGLSLWTFVLDGFEAGHKFARRFGFHKTTFDEEVKAWRYERI